MKPIRLLSLFSGMGAFEKAFENKGIPYEVANYSELDESFAKAYSILHDVPIEKNLGDITKIDLDKLPSDIDLMTWGFPCVSFSKARHESDRKGLGGNGSELYFNGLDILRKVKPNVSIIENVAPLVKEAKFKNHYDMIMNDLDNSGYNSVVMLLNAKDYGIPQNRERVLIVSTKKELGLKIKIPEKVEKCISAKDLFDKDVDEKFFKVNPIIVDKIKKTNCRDWSILPTITRAIGRAGSSKEYIRNCAFVYHHTNELRRMTPCECIKFMGFDDLDFKKMKDGKISDTAIYNMAGNSISVPLLECVYNELYNPK